MPIYPNPVEDTVPSPQDPAGFPMGDEPVRVLGAVASRHVVRAMGFEYSVFRVLEEQDLRIQVFRPGRLPGEWGVPNLDAAVRITHLPTGIEVTCSSERSQLANKAKALQELEEKLACSCGHVMIDSTDTGSRNWEDLCPVHGVGTEYFKNLPSMPFGYAGERHTSREEWVAFRKKEDRK